MLSFMKEFHNKWLSKVLGTKQSGTFWEWAVKMRLLNTLLHGTTTYLDDATLLNQLKVNLKLWLSCACDDQRIKEDTLDKWLDKVKIVDKKKHGECQQQWADAEEATHSHLKWNTMSAGLSELSCHYNTFHGGLMNDKNASSNKGKPFNTTKNLLKLMDVEQTLLFDNKGCLKCRCFFVNHCSMNCPNKFPSGVGYKTLTADNVKSAHHKMSNPVTLVSELSCSSGILPITAIMPPANNNAVLEGNSSDLSKDSDDSVSGHSVPFSILHYHWRCVVDGMDSLDHLKIEVLIDNGSHTVLIHENLMNNLKLRR